MPESLIKQPCTGNDAFPASATVTCAAPAPARGSVTPAPSTVQRHKSCAGWGRPGATLPHPPSPPGWASARTGRASSRRGLGEEKRAFRRVPQEPSRMAAPLVPRLVGTARAGSRSLPHPACLVLHMESIQPGRERLLRLHNRPSCRSHARRQRSMVPVISSCRSSAEGRSGPALGGMAHKRGRQSHGSRAPAVRTP
ncbi:hypothetical protein STPH2_2793 [Streptomyces sp. KO7888]|nr:hypothetical protein [Streptomyces sp. KO7888]